MKTDDGIEIAQSYFRALNAKDLSQVPFAEDVVLECPITPKLVGIKSVLEFLEGVFTAIKEVRLQQCVADGEYVAARFELDTIYGLIPAADRLRISDGKIRELQPHYDPRPLTQRAT